MWGKEVEDKFDGNRLRVSLCEQGNGKKPELRNCGGDVELAEIWSRENIGMAQFRKKAKQDPLSKLYFFIRIGLSLGRAPLSSQPHAINIVFHCEQLGVRVVAITPMSLAHSQNTPSSSSQFQQIFNSALKAYEKRTKKDLLLHPLAAQLQACDSPDAILAVLQNQLNELNQSGSRNADDRWSKWLDPTVNVLCAFSATLGEGVGLVCLRIWTDMRNAL